MKTCISLFILGACLFNTHITIPAATHTAGVGQAKISQGPQFFTRETAPGIEQLVALQPYMPTFVHERYGTEGITALHKAVEWLSLPVVEFLVQHHANINAQRTDNGNTPLMSAAKMADPRARAIVDFLVRQGAHTDIPNKKGYTVLTHPQTRPEYKELIHKFQASQRPEAKKEMAVAKISAEPEQAPQKSAAQHTAPTAYTGPYPASAAWMQPISADVDILMRTPAPGESDIPFDRERIIHAEGYWAEHPTGWGEYPFPIAHPQRWPHQREFIEKLYHIEHLIEENSRGSSSNGKPIYMMKYRGRASSRLVPTEDVGSGEFVDTLRHVSWPEGYWKHYILRFNVIPSRQFYRYVMNLSLDQLRKNVA